MAVGRWDGRSRGGSLVIRLAWPIARLLGRRGIRLVALLVCWPVLLLLPSAWRGADAYWRRRRPDLGAAERWGMIWRQIASFGTILIDRGLVYCAGVSVPFLERGWRHVLEAHRAGRGAVLLSAHIGNWELSGRRVTHYLPDLVMNLVKVENEDPAEREMVRAAMGDRAPRIIDPRDPLAASLAIREALGRGEMVCMLGDRVVPGQPSIQADLLGCPVHLPAGPFLVAGMAGVPVIPCFLMRTRSGAYRLEAGPPWSIALPTRGAQRQRVLQHHLQRWADRLADQVRRYPLQWHNFYDLWRQGG